ncbi:Uncharacterised protein [Mycobacteroides abscessus subsp. abscessus]|nr:Uncharacterised protein [Mycobacteroides abscessus subsp. abscessus]
MLDQIDLTHAPGAEQSEHAVPGEGVPDLQRHGRMLAAAIARARRLHVTVPVRLRGRSRRPQLARRMWRVRGLVGAFR